MPLALFGPAANVVPQNTGMSDAEFFGAPAPQAAPTPVPHPAKAGMSDAEFFGGAPAAPAAPEQPGFWDRASLNAQHEFQTGTSEAAAGNVALGTISDSVEKNLRQQGFTDAADSYHRALVAQDAGVKKQYDDMPSWNSAPTLGGKVAGGAAALLGSIGGSLFTPESFLGVGEKGAAAIEHFVAPKVEKIFGKTLAPAATKVITGGTEQAAINTVTDPAVQGLNIAAGKQDGYNINQTLMAGPLGFLVGGSIHAPGAMADAFKAWRAARPAIDPKAKAPAADAAPTPQEVDAFASSPEMAGFLKANGITDPKDPMVLKLQDRLKAIQDAKASPFGNYGRDPRQSNIQGGDPVDTSKFKDRRISREMSVVNADIEAKRKAAAEIQSGQAGERDKYGILQDGRDPSTVGLFPPKPVVPDVIPIGPTGRADGGDMAAMAGADKFGAERAGLPAVTAPQPDRMTPEEIARSQAKMNGGNANTAEPPPRLVAGENRLPRTPDQVLEGRQAGQAFDLAASQRERVGTLDTQTAGRPEGVDASPVTMDEGFPVKVLDRQTKDIGGKHVEMATVHRYDPRTGAVDPEAMPYEVPVRQLKTKNYATDPRQAQDFAARAKGPGNPELDRTPEQPISHGPDQTYRATAADPNTDFPGASHPGPAEGRSPLPDQPDGLHPGPARPRGEEEAIRDFQARQQNPGAGPSSDGARPGDSKASNTAKPAGEDGRFEVDDRGFVNSDKGGPVKFSDQKQAAKWIVNVGHKLSPDQIFEIENHPSGSGFGVHERGRSEMPKEPPPSPPPGGSDGVGGARAAKGAGDSSPRTLLPRAADKATHTSALEDVQRARAEPPKKVKTNGSLFDAIRRHGGIKDDHGDVAQIMQGHKNAPFQKRVVNPDGKSPDAMREALQQEGWFGPADRHGKAALETGSYPGDSTHDLYDLMDRAARGKEVVHPDSVKTDGEHEFDARAMLDEEMSRAGITDRDSHEEAAQKLADFRDSSRFDFLTRERANNLVDDGHLSSSDLEGFQSYGYQDQGGQNGEFGSPEKQPGSNEAGANQPEDLPGWESVHSADGGKASGADSGNRENFHSDTVDLGRGKTAEQTNIPGSEKSAKQAAAAQEAAGHGKMKSKADQKDAGGMFEPSNEDNQHDLFGGDTEAAKQADGIRNTFYSNPIGDPEVWRSFGRVMKKTMGLEEGGTWARHLESMVSAIPDKRPLSDRDASFGRARRAYNKVYPVYHALSIALMANDGVLRTMAHRYVSPVMKEIANDFFPAPRGTRNFVPKRDYFQSINTAKGQWENRVDALLKPFAKMKEADKQGVLDQVGRLIVNPGAIKPGTAVHDAAAGIGKMLKEIHTYMRDAGVDVGEVKRGYLPRIENMDKVLAKPDAFLTQARKALMASGATAKDAHEGAQQWLDRLMLGDLGVNTGGNDFAQIGGASNTPNFSRARVLTKAADEIMGDFYHRNPADIMPRYIAKAVKKAEWSRRFGVRDAKAPVPRGEDPKAWRSDQLGKWKDMKARMIADGAESAIPEVVRIISSMTGNMGKAATGLSRNVLSTTRTWGALAYLSRATLSSLSEPVSIAIRTGNTLDLFKAYGNTVRHWVPMLRAIGDGHHLEDMAKDLGFIGDAIDNISMLARVGNDDNTLLNRRLQGAFFKNVGLTQFTEANRVSAMQAGMVFMRRLAIQSADKGGHFQTMASNQLKELGVSDVAKFASWVMARDGKPHIDDILEGGDQGVLYHTALGRFLSQTVMHPTGAIRPRYAQHPLGSLLYNLQSFTYAFQKNVLNRVGAMTMDAFDPKSGLNGYERVASLVPLFNLVPLLGIQYALGEIRDQLLPDPARAGQQPKTTFNKLLTAGSRAGLDGIIDPELNMFTQARYQRDPTTALQGPILGTPGQVMGDAATYFSAQNSPNTNTTERKVARDFYDLVIKPTLIAGVSAAAPPEAKLGLALGAAGIFGISHPAMREGFVKKVAGPPLPPR